MSLFRYDHIRALRTQGHLTRLERLAWAWGRLCDALRLR